MRGFVNAAEHHAVELPRAADRHRAGRRAESGHDAGQHAIALVPVEAGDMKRDLQRSSCM